jgi:hypothetical protein
MAILYPTKCPTNPEEGPLSHQMLSDACCLQVSLPCFKNSPVPAFEVLPTKGLGLDQIATSRTGVGLRHMPAKGVGFQTVDAHWRAHLQN